MSYCYDVMAKVWADLRDKLPADVRDGEVAERFGFLIEHMHEANHRLKDGINHDRAVSNNARKLDEVFSLTKKENQDGKAT